MGIEVVCCVLVVVVAGDQGVILLATAVLYESGDLFGYRSTGEHEASATAPLFTDKAPVAPLQNPPPDGERALPRKEKTTGAGIALTEG